MLGMKGRCRFTLHINCAISSASRVARSCTSTRNGPLPTIARRGTPGVFYTPVQMAGYARADLMELGRAVVAFEEALEGGVTDVLRGLAHSDVSENIFAALISTADNTLSARSWAA